MKRFFYWLLIRYSKTEKQRIKILSVLDEQVRDNYNEQTLFGNVYNYFIEFVIANPFIVKNVMLNDKETLNILKSGIYKSYDEAINYIKKENKN